MRNLEAEEFNRGLDVLISNLLSDNGRPYAWFKCVKQVSNQYLVDWDRLKIHFSSYVGPTMDIQAITHELGHLMIARDEAIGRRSWGLENPYILISRYGADPIQSDGLTPQLKGESKVWAWQYLIELMAGLRKEGDPLPIHPEAEFLSDISYASDDFSDIVEASFRSELEKLQKTDWRAKIKDRLSGMSDTLARVRDQRFDYERADANPPILKIFKENLADGDFKAVVLYDVGQGYYAVDVEFHSDDTGDIYRRLTLTKNFRRAERFFEISVALNQTPDHNAQLELAPDNDLIPVPA